MLFVVQGPAGDASEIFIAIRPSYSVTTAHVWCFGYMARCETRASPHGLTYGVYEAKARTADFFIDASAILVRRLTRPGTLAWLKLRMTHLNAAYVLYWLSAACNLQHGRRSYR